MELRTRLTVRRPRAAGDAPPGGRPFRLAVLRPDEDAAPADARLRLLSELVLSVDDAVAERVRAGDVLDVTITLRPAGD